MGIIAVSDESSLVSGKCQTIRTGLDHCLSTGVAFIVVVAVLFVRKHSIVFISAKILSRLSSAGLSQTEIKISGEKNEKYDEKLHNYCDYCVNRIRVNTH
jgi:hypothetical protein